MPYCAFPFADKESCAESCQHLREDFFLAKETTLLNLLTKKTTYKCNWQKRPLSLRPQVTRGTCRHSMWRQELAVTCRAAPSVTVNCGGPCRQRQRWQGDVEDASIDCGGRPRPLPKFSASSIKYYMAGDHAIHWHWRRSFCVSIRYRSTHVLSTTWPAHRPGS
jgi:hypothetical protein